MRKLYLFAAMAAMLAACSENDLTAEKQVVQQNADDGAVVFDAYQSRGTTRAGKTGTMTLDVLKQTDAGFGVFGYYTNNETYSELAKPDFMYNQDVKYDNTYGWLYAPIKYWPNEYGTDAASERIDYLSFFAYAPYVVADPKTGKVASKSDETGIIGLTRNTAIGDPLVKYVANFDPAKAVDLCWGVVAGPSNFTETVPTTTEGVPTNNLTPGKPYKDVIKPTTTSKIKFDFKHALAQLNVQIDADIDQPSHGDNPLNDQTRIYVRSVSFEGFTDKGTLNLNSDAPNPTWYDISGTGNLSTKAVTIYDGRYDGREGVASVQAPAELPLGLNSMIIQSKGYKTPFDNEASDPGVTTSPVNLFNGAETTTPIMVIPNNQPLKVTIVYDVETYDPSLAQFLSDGKTHGSTIENAITKEIQIGGTTKMYLEAGKRHIVKLHLGLTSVKFDAEVAEWDPTAPTEGEADLPINSPGDAGNAIAAGTLAVDGALNVNMSAAAGTLDFTFVSTAGKTVSGDITIKSEARTPNVTIDDVSIYGTVTASDGKAAVRLIVPANTTTKTVVRTVTIKDGGTNEAIVTITQGHQALGLKIENGPKAKDTTTPILLKAATGVMMESGDFNVSTWTVKRKRSGTFTNLEYTSGDLGANKFKAVEVDNGTGNSYTAKLTFYADDDVLAGDEYEITVQAGNADPETVTYIVPKAVGTISFSQSNKDWNINDNGASFSSQTATASGTSITYSIVRTSGNSNPEIGTQAFINPSSGLVTITSPTVGDVFTVTATVSDDENYTYNDRTAIYTINIVDTPIP